MTDETGDEDLTLEDIHPNDLPRKVHAAVRNCKDPWTALDEEFTSDEVYQMLRHHNKSRSTKKHQRIRALIIRAYRNTDDEMPQPGDDYRLG